MDIIEEIKFPSMDNEWIPKVLIGGFLGTVPIINFFVYGYYMKVLKAASEDTPELPKWDDWGNLFISGLIVFIVSTIYFLVPVIVASLFFGGLVISAISTGTMDLGVIGAAMGGFLISIFLLLISSFILPMALSMYIKEDSIGAAFRIGELLSRIKSVLGDYLVVIVVVFILFFILGMIASIPFFGWVIFLLGKFYILVVAASMYGKVYDQSKAQN